MIKARFWPVRFRRYLPIRLTIKTNTAIITLCACSSAVIDIGWQRPFEQRENAARCTNFRPIAKY